jgi:hypothetical protein
VLARYDSTKNPLPPDLVEPQGGGVLTGVFWRLASNRPPRVTGKIKVEPSILTTTCLALVTNTASSVVIYDDSVEVSSNFDLIVGSAFNFYNNLLVGTPTRLVQCTPWVAEPLAEPLAKPDVEMEEQEIEEFRCLSPRVESIAALRNKIKLTKPATDFAKGVRLHTFRIEEDVEEQSE